MHAVLFYYDFVTTAFFRVQILPGFIILLKWSLAQVECRDGGAVTLQKITCGILIETIIPTFRVERRWKNKTEGEVA